jgi:AcrR family transcriptional regulator
MVTHNVVTPIDEPPAPDSFPNTAGGEGPQQIVIPDSFTGTKEHIFLTAERLFAQEGYQAVSVRQITREAGTNLASVSYYFGSREDLIFAIFCRRRAQLNDDRLQQLNRVLSRKREPEVIDLIRAYVTPALLWERDDRAISMQFLNRAPLEAAANVRELLDHDVRHVNPFIEALQSARPQMSREEICWRFNFTLNVFSGNSPSSDARLVAFSNGECTPGDPEAFLERALDFVELAWYVPKIR